MEKFETDRTKRWERNARIAIAAVESANQSEAVNAAQVIPVSICKTASIRLAIDCSRIERWKPGISEDDYQNEVDDSNWHG